MFAFAWFRAFPKKEIKASPNQISAMSKMSSPIVSTRDAVFFNRAQTRRCIRKWRIAKHLLCWTWLIQLHSINHDSCIVLGMCMCTERQNRWNIGSEVKSLNLRKKCARYLAKRVETTNLLPPKKTEFEAFFVFFCSCFSSFESVGFPSIFSTRPLSTTNLVIVLFIVMRQQQHSFWIGFHSPHFLLHSH